MDNFKILWVLSIVGMILFSCQQSQKSTTVDTAQASDTIVVVTIDTIPSIPKRGEIATIAQAREVMNNTEDSALYNAGILPRMLDEVPDYAIKLLNSEYSRFIIADKYTLRVLLYDSYGRAEKEYKMTCSRNYGTKHAKRDNRTPEGFFSIEGIYDSTEWLYRDDDGNVSQKKGQFGPRFIRLKIPVTTQIGIHGTCSPWSLGGRYSHGCIRISNENILELVKLVEPGMPVIVSPGPRDMAVNKEEGFDIPAVSTGAVRPTPSASPQTKPETQTDSAAKDSLDKPVKADSIIPQTDMPMPATPEPIPVNTVPIPQITDPTPKITEPTPEIPVPTPNISES